MIYVISVTFLNNPELVTMLSAACQEIVLNPIWSLPRKTINLLDSLKKFHSVVYLVFSRAHGHNGLQTPSHDMDVSNEIFTVSAPCTLNRQPAAAKVA